jgi:DNA-binding transcriptional regulator YdaS (Cro superfamily)
VTGSDLAAQLARMGLKQVDAGRLLGVSPRTIRGWITGERAVPAWLVLFLDVLEVVPGARERVLWRLEG